MTELFHSLPLYQYPSLASSAVLPGDLGILPCHTYCLAWSFLCFLPVLRPPSGSWSTGSSGYSRPLGVPIWTLTMLGCAVLTPSPLAAPSPFVVVDFFLGRFFGLGLVGRVRASVPTFWWCSPSLVLGFAWRLWPFGGLVMAPSA